MPRLIDADALNWWDDLFMKGVNQSGVWVRYKDVEHFIKDAPTIDAVPVVRCVECEMANPCSDEREMYCALYHSYKRKNYYCADGRREDGDTP